MRTPLLVLLLVLFGSAALATERDAPVHAVRLAPGREVRAYTGSQALQGLLREAEPGVLRLESPDGSLHEALLSDVRLLEVRGSGAPGGALWGGATVGWLGGGLGTAFCILANALRESGDALSISTCTLVGTAVGGGLGAGLGALVGLAVDTWPAAYAPDARRPTPLQLSYGGAETPLPRERDRVELGLGLGLLLDPEEGGVPLHGARTRLHLLLPVGERVSVGAEASFGQLDHFVTRTGLYTRERDADLTQGFADVGLRARYWLGPDGAALRPLLSAGLALQGVGVDARPPGSESTQSAEGTGLAASFGGGLDWVPVPGAPGLTLEALWRQGLSPEGPRVSHLELAVTGALRF